MDAKVLNVYPVTVGQRELLVLSGSGSAAYTAAAGDPIKLPAGIYLDAVFPCMTVSKTYEVRFFPSATDTTRATWTAKWYTVASSEVTGPTDLSAEKVQFGAFGGNF